MKRDHPYYLGKNEGFYNQLSSFTNRLTRVGFHKFHSEIDGYKKYITREKIEEPHSRDEYLIDFLMVGILWNCYSYYGCSFKKWQKPIFMYLIELRKKNDFLKKLVDKFRGIMTGILLGRKLETKPVFSLVNFSLLTDWLDSTGEFSKETARLELFKRYLYTLPVQKRENIIGMCISSACFFEDIAKRYLGKFTLGVQGFRNENQKKDKFREDRIFRQRHEVEYHLNMVAAEIMNQAFREEFTSKPKKLVLLPTCTRESENCKAIMKNGALTCTTCSRNCNAGRITRQLRLHGHDSVLIPHSSGFSHLLKRWKNDKSIALVGVACVLNLIEGGYAMKNLNVASQCVFLDYSGCKKHWHKAGIPTNLNGEQLMRIVGGNEIHKSYPGITESQADMNCQYTRKFKTSAASTKCVH